MNLLEASILSQEVKHDLKKQIVDANLERRKQQLKSNIQALKNESVET